MKLLARILRFFASAEELRVWNGLEESDGTFTFDSWTEFVRSLNPLVLFNDITNEPRDKVENRERVWSEIFSVLGKEEEYRIGGCGSY